VVTLDAWNVRAAPQELRLGIDKLFSTFSGAPKRTDRLELETRPILTLIGAVIATFLVAGSGMATAADLTAQAARPQAVAAARKWRPDAMLTHVSSITVNADGSAKSCLYTFYASRSKKSLIVTAAGTTLETLEVPNTSVQPIGEGFLDSNQAMREAKKHDLKGSSPSMGLVVMGFTGAPTWSVNGGFAEGDVSVILDGKTGKFIRRQVISYK
jgi:hypothetical protein